MEYSQFSTLALNSNLIKSTISLGYNKLTPIQAETLPEILKGFDVIGQGVTGSGKTAAFSIGILNKLDAEIFKIQALVLCPTRELADQVAREIRKLGCTIHNIKVLTLCGGSAFGLQKGSLAHGAHIIVGTPGRILDHLDKNNLSLGSINTLVLDEADRLLDMGFQTSLDAIIEYLPENRQTLLFSATFDDDISSIATKIMRKPKIIKVASVIKEKGINQNFYLIKNEASRFNALKLILFRYLPKSTIIFCETKKEVQAVANNLIDLGFSASPLHGDLDQKDRDQTLLCFSNKSLSILVATDVAARGIDISSLSAVFNYKLARDVKSHIHRIGRTGRAGSSGNIYNLYTEREGHKITLLEKHFDQIIIPKELPSMNVLLNVPLQPQMRTIQIDGGKKQKLRAGDIVGALTGDGTIKATKIGDINIKDNWSYVAIEFDIYPIALTKLSTGKLKGRNFRVRLISNNK